MRIAKIRTASPHLKSTSPANPSIKQAIAFLRDFDAPGAISYERARQILNKFLDGDISTPLTPEDGLLFLTCCALSGVVLPGYATLDWEHVNEIRQLLEKIKTYSEDTSQKRPLNFLMLASPGAGKSHFIRCIANRLDEQKIGAVTFNMVGLQRHEDLIPPLDAARNLKVGDKIPLLFLDEFDADPGNIPLLLPLLWDGEVTVGQHNLKLGKVVIVLAGSDPRLPLAMEFASSLRPEPPPPDSHHPKVVDLLSRINGGVLRIPKLSDPHGSSTKRADKVCIAVGLLQQRFGPTLKRAPLSLIRFIAKTEFRYGIRSIAHLIELIPYTEGTSNLTSSDLDLPLSSAKDLKASSLAYHLLSEDQALGIVDSWKAALKGDMQVPVASRTLESLSRNGIGKLEDSLLINYLVRRLLDEVMAADGPKTRKRRR